MRRLLGWMLLGFLIGTGGASSANGGWGDVLRDAVDAVREGDRLDNAEIVDGLKEALEVATIEAVQRAGRENGYFQNPDIKIPLPESVAKTEALLRGAGMGDELDTFVRRMNRAAEQAAPEARAIFWDAIEQMSFDDARRILNGRENEATLYFRDQTSEALTAAFKPLVHRAMQGAGVTQQYQRLQSSAEAVPFLSEWLVDLDDYVTAEALDGLFFLLAQEEARIRKDPAARTTELLQKVFANP